MVMAGFSESIRKINKVNSHNQITGHWIHSFFYIDELIKKLRLIWKMRNCLSIMEIDGVWKLLGYKIIHKQDNIKLIQMF